jgi:Protein of unknown function (DUF1638)
VLVPVRVWAVPVSMLRIVGLKLWLTIFQRRCTIVLIEFATQSGQRLLSTCKKETGSSLAMPTVPGSHCYEFFAGAQVFADLADAEPGTFYLTDYLARHFEPLIMGALGIDKHPELRDMYFGNYARVVFLDQMSNPDLLVAAQAAATRLGLAFEHHPTGLDPFAVAVRDLVTAAVAA